MFAKCLCRGFFQCWSQKYRKGGDKGVIYASGKKAASWRRAFSGLYKSRQSPAAQIEITRHKFEMEHRSFWIIREISIVVRFIIFHWQNERGLGQGALFESDPEFGNQGVWLTNWTVMTSRKAAFRANLSGRFAAVVPRWLFVRGRRGSLEVSFCLSISRPLWGPLSWSTGAVKRRGTTSYEFEINVAFPQLRWCYRRSNYRR